MMSEFLLKIKDQFKAEELAYNGYKAIKEMAEDELLEEALEEIMYDEYLHAKFLRSYLMEKQAYDLTQFAELERIYKQMSEWF